MYVTRKHLGPPTDKPAFVFPRVSVSKPLQNSEQGTKSLFPHHPITPDLTTTEKDWTAHFAPNPWCYRTGPGVQVPRSQLHRKPAANPACSNWGLFCKLTPALSLFMHKRMRFFSDINNILVNHKTLLPSSFAEIGVFFYVSTRVLFFLSFLIQIAAACFSQKSKTTFKPLHLWHVFHAVIFCKQLQQLSCRLVPLRNTWGTEEKPFVPRNSVMTMQWSF